MGIGQKNTGKTEMQVVLLVRQTFVAFLSLLLAIALCHQR